MYNTSWVVVRFILIYLLYAQERQIRHLLKSYKATLVAELQHCSRASIRQRKRVSDQFAEFEVHEGKLVGWGLKFIIPFFRMQAWSRLSRSTLMRDLSLELEQYVILYFYHD
mgnify:CR=1 FL=1